MKRLVSIVLLLLFLFNVGGYYAVYWWLSYQAKVEMDHRLDDANYSAEETITTKIPLTLPYYFDQKDYERVEGSYEQDGEFFKLIKQKFERDTLYVVSIKDHKEKSLFNTMVDFVKLSNDLPTSSHQTLRLLADFMKDFAFTAMILTQQHPGWIMTFEFTPLHPPLLANHLPIFSPPPDSFV